MKNESHNPWTDPEIEARIVALVLGEASDFEREELNRLMEEWPDLAAFMEKIQGVHDLLGAAAAGEWVAEDDDWKLPEKARNAVLAAIGEGTVAQTAEPVDSAELPEKQSLVRRSRLWNLTKVAAALSAAALVGVFAIPYLFDGATGERLARLQRFVLSMNNYHDVYKSAPPMRAGTTMQFLSENSATTTSEDDFFRNGQPVAAARYDYEEDSRSALSSMRSTLDADGVLPSPNYFYDDLEYYAEEHTFKRPQEAAGLRFVPVEKKGNRTTAALIEGRASDRSTPDSGVDAPTVVTATDGVDGGAFATRRHRSAGREPGQKVFASSSGGDGLDFPRFEARAGDHDTSSPAAGAMTTFGLRSAGRVQLAEGKQPNGAPGEAGASDLTGESGESARSSLMERDWDKAPSKGKTWQDTANAKQSTLGNSPTENNGSTDLSGLSAPDVTSESGESRGGWYWGTPSKGLEGDAATDPGARSGNHRLLHVAPGRAQEPSSGIQDPRAGITAGQGIQPERGYTPAAPQPTTGTVLALPLGESRGTSTVQGKRLDDTRDSRGGVGLDVLRSGGESSQTFDVEDADRPTTSTRIEALRSKKELSKDSFESFAKLGDFGTNKQGGGGRAVGGSETNITRFGRLALPEEEEEEGEQEELLRRRDPSENSGRERWNGYIPPTLAGHSKSHSLWKEKVRASAGLGETSAQEKAVSTFSLFVSDVSFKLARAALAGGRWPEAAEVRIEQFVNAFDYGDPLPTRNERVSCRLEQTVHPFLQQRNLLRVSVRTASAGRSDGTPLRLTLLLDNSGSMERTDRQQTVRRAFSLLAEQLTPIDQITLISFAREPRLLADKVSGAQSKQLLELIADLPSEGGTNIEAALQLAFEKASEQQIDGGQNRIILLTDGAVNLGDADPDNLLQMVTTIRSAGIAFDAAGICSEGLNDEVLEALTRKGDGRYYLLDSLEAADGSFARQVAGALRPSAKNVKVQVEFNPERVGRYRLLGFEKHLLKQEDFRNDSVDAAEMAAAETGVAMYQFEAKSDGQGDIGSVSVRFRDLSTGQMIENRWPIPYEAGAPSPDQAAPSLRIAVAAALFAAKLRGEALGETVDLKTLSDLIAGLPDRERKAARIQQLYEMIQQARQVSGQ